MKTSYNTICEMGLEQVVALIFESYRIFADSSCREDRTCEQCAMGWLNAPAKEKAMKALGV